MTTLRDARQRDSFWLPYHGQIHEITPEYGSVATYRLVLDSKLAGYHFRPGQFNMLYLPGLGEVAISISGDPSRTDRLDHTIRVAGNVTKAIAQLGVGGNLALRGPYGSWWPLDEWQDADVTVVAGGIGLAPLRPVILHLLARRAQYGRLVLLLGGRTPDSLLFRREYASWQHEGFDLQVTVDRAEAAWKGNVGVVTLLLDRLRPFDVRRSVLFVCGPEVMMEYTVRSAMQRGLPPDRIWLSLERNMQCAVGLCGHCQLGPAFVCKDGPIFRYDKIAPFLRIAGL